MNLLKYNWKKYVGRRQPPLRGELVLRGNLGWFKKLGLKKDLSKLFIFFADISTDGNVVSNQYINANLEKYILLEFKKRLKHKINYATKIISALKKDTLQLNKFSVKLDKLRTYQKPIKIFEDFCDYWEKFGPNLYAYLLLVEACENVILEDYLNDSEAKPALMKEVSSQIESEFFKSDKIVVKKNKSYFSAKQKPYIKLLIKMGEYRDQRKATYEKCWYDYSVKFLEYLGKETGLGDKVVFLSSKEITKILKNHKLQHNIKLPNLIYAKKGKVCLEYGDKVEIFRTNLIKQTVGNSAELKGNIANKGKVVGKVRQVIAHTLNQEFKKGEILITKMTTPDLVPLIKLASAIVTDEGGITSHAAIVSREFDIPCVIATNYATQVFKTGDLVEVNADKGIVKKIF